MKRRRTLVFLPGLCSSAAAENNPPNETNLGDDTDRLWGVTWERFSSNGIFYLQAACWKFRRRAGDRG